MNKKITECRRCGNCCKKGGPSLHKEDLGLVNGGVLPLSSLITIRKGEIVHNPQSNRAQAASVELVKIVGTGRDWDCCYYDEYAGCTIYTDRPLACRVLKCWDTDDILALVEKETLGRFDILKMDDPLVEVINEYERLCPSFDFQSVFLGRHEISKEQKKILEKTVREDLRFRSRVIVDFQLKLSHELFYFGRPLFQLLEPFGVRTVETTMGINLVWSKKSPASPRKWGSRTHQGNI